MGDPGQDSQLAGFVGELRKRVHELERERAALPARQAHVEQALRASQARFAGIVGLCDDAIISIDGNQRINLFNQGAEKIFGYRAEEILGQPLDALIPRRFIAAHRLHVRDFGASADALRPMNERGTIFGLRKDGSEFPAEATILKFAVEGEQVLTVRMRDITERLRGEAALRHLEERLTVLVEASTALLSSLELSDVLPAILDLSRRLVEADAYAVWRCDPVTREWRVVSAVGLSEACQRTAGRIGEDSQGAPELPLSVEDVEQMPLPEHRREAYRAEGIRSLLAVPLRIHGRRSGTIAFYCRRAHKFSETEIRVAGALANLAASAIGTAELYEEQRRLRVEAEAALEAFRGSQARFRRLVDSGIIGIILGEADRITEANDVFLDMVGYTRQDLASGKPLGPEITPPEYHHLDAHALVELRERGACAPFEKEFLRKDGQRVPVLMGAALLETCPALSWVGFVIDLTERKDLEARLRESQKLESVGLLAGGVAHDFNNLLTGIMGNASLAQEVLPQNSPALPILENVVRASQHAADLTRQLLAYSGKGRFVVRPVHISRLVREISSLLLTSVPRKVQLLLNLAEDLPPVDADSGQMRQLVMNLVINAAEAIGENPGTVMVTTGAQEVDEAYVQKSSVGQGITPGKYVFLEVHDTGCGMDEETKACIFEPFFTTKFTGRGLGLAAVLGIVRGHRGDIQVHSKPGKGSTFRVLLPASEGHLPEAEPVLPQRALEGVGTVLVVDDEEVVRETVKATLKRYRYRVVLAENGQEAVELFRQMADQIALVLLDMTLPVMSGEEAFQHLKRIRPAVPVIVSSGYNDVEALRRFTGKGVAAFIQKPYTPVQLADKIKRVLEGGRFATANQSA